MAAGESLNVVHKQEASRNRWGTARKRRRPEAGRNVMRASKGMWETVGAKLSCLLHQVAGLQAARQALRLQRETGSLQTATKEAGPRCAPQAARSLHTAREPSFGRVSV